MATPVQGGIQVGTPRAAQEWSVVCLAYWRAWLPMSEAGQIGRLPQLPGNGAWLTPQGGSWPGPYVFVPVQSS